MHIILDPCSVPLSIFCVTIYTWRFRLIDLFYHWKLMELAFIRGKRVHISFHVDHGCPETDNEPCLYGFATSET